MTQTEAFEELGIGKELLDACSRLEWSKPTPIQQLSIPPILQGRNLVALAETGSGKTAAYALPILQTLLHDPNPYFALVLVPTRELAAQVQAQFNALGNAVGLSTILLVGGVPISQQADLMRVSPPHILIATPGRFVDHLKKTKGFDELKLARLRFLVIDEADRMLGSDFESVLDRILCVVPPNRQTLLFSATMTGKVGKLQRTSIRDPVCVSTRKSKFQALSNLRQYVHLVPQGELDTYLVHLLRIALCPELDSTGLDFIRLHPNEENQKDDSRMTLLLEIIGSARSRQYSVCPIIPDSPPAEAYLGQNSNVIGWDAVPHIFSVESSVLSSSVIVFTRTRVASNQLNLLLRQFLRQPVIALNGDMPQAQRLGALHKFKRTHGAVLVATDVASRGLDIPQVGLVINYDVPLDAKTYMHRVGRTARAGRTGCALTLLTQYSVVFFLKEIESHLVASAGQGQDHIPALVEPGSLVDKNLEKSVEELHIQVKEASARALQAVDSMKKRVKFDKNATTVFTAVDDLPTPSVNNLPRKPGLKRTAWASEAPASKLNEIEGVLDAMHVDPCQSQNSDNFLAESTGSDHSMNAKRFKKHTAKRSGKTNLNDRFKHMTGKSKKRKQNR